ncbi:DNA-3-methyladenine glycosylase I [Succinatimonas hippei]|uniref:DNA-3-methyladenine glycosylase I n=1 Tax=Succinatimonas hippei TaxID=626938 RepID=UPI002011FA65|nr:DNA-3-methyladenine glycosylase I [Succinatimonas hippei]MCL1602424.1 DNA-3-methyladenine glycosylase I [Succinatimonas hippei]
MIKKHRCKWVNLNNPLYVAYHDTEWGNPVFDDHCLFEMLILESFQAGLSWECVLNKRKDFKIAFDNFELNKIINYDDNKIAELLSNEKIIRNRLKIKAAISNAKIFKEIQKETKSFSNYLWHWTDYKIIHETGKTSSALSDAISKDLQKRGMKFVGTTIIYSYLQAVGVINSHEKDCFLAPQIR